MSVVRRRTQHYFNAVAPLAAAVGGYYRGSDVVRTTGKIVEGAKALYKQFYTYPKGGKALSRMVISGRVSGIRKKSGGGQIPPTPDSKMDVDKPPRKRSRAGETSRPMRPLNLSSSKNAGTQTNQMANGRVGFRRRRRMRRPSRGGRRIRSGRRRRLSTRRRGGRRRRVSRRRTNRNYNFKLAQRVAFRRLQENRETKTDEHCAYFGHGSATASFTQAMCGALYARLSAKAGVFVRGWDDLAVLDTAMTQQRSLYVTYLNATGALAQHTLTFSTGWTHRECVDHFTAWVLSITHPLRMKSIAMFHTVEVSALTHSITDATIYMQDLVLHFYFTSTIKFQNQTKSGVAGETEDSITDIGANPLVGKKYVTRGWANGFNRKTGTSAAGWTAKVNDLDGMLSCGSSTAGGVGSSYMKPPAASEFNAKVQKIRLDPGAIGQSTIKFSCKIGMEALRTKVPDLFQNEEASTYLVTPCPFGKAELFALEKHCDTGSNTLITIGMQVDQTYACYCTETRPRITRNTYVEALPALKVANSSLPKEVLPPVVEEDESDVETEDEISLDSDEESTPPRKKSRFIEMECGVDE